MINELFFSDVAASLYDGGWRCDDFDELQREYKFTDDEATKICTLMQEYEGNRD